jgi:hypothetical protein
MEGSSYEGFMVRDQVYLGESYHEGLDQFEFTFGCVTKETNLFYDQAADGILGLGMGHGLNSGDQKPIYQSMFDDGIISQ